MKDYLAHAVPEIEKIISTEQFKLSEERLDLRFALGLSFYETTELLNLNPNIYIKYKYADTDLSPSDYQAVINKLKTYQKDKPACSNT
jgi:hypothetical protein